MLTNGIGRWINAFVAGLAMSTLWIALTHLPGHIGAAYVHTATVTVIGNPDPDPSDDRRTVSETAF